VTCLPSASDWPEATHEALADDDDARGRSPSSAQGEVAAAEERMPVVLK